MNINIAICDDQILFLSEMKIKINSLTNLKNHNCKFCYFNSGKDLLQSLKSGKIFDTIFLDIELEEEILGTHIGTMIKQITPEVLIIYMSSYNDYFTDLVVSEPFDFLNKPIEIEGLTNTVNKLIRRLHFLKMDYTYTIKFNGIYKQINLKEVLYFESQHRIINIYFIDGECFHFYKKLDEVSNEIQSIYPFFIRINKSYLVNFNYSESFNKENVKINSQIIKVSSKYKNEVFDFIYKNCTNKL